MVKLISVEYVTRIRINSASELRRLTCKHNFLCSESIVIADYNESLIPSTIPFLCCNHCKHRNDRLKLHSTHYHSSTTGLNKISNVMTGLKQDSTFNAKTWLILPVYVFHKTDNPICVYVLCTYN